jgi:hypothetical protein
VAQPEGSQRVKIGILLARRVDDIGEWLADAGAFDAAGADALWIDLANAPELDPLTVTAALAAVTSRSTLVAVLPAAAEPSPASARTLVTVARLSHGRLRVARDIPPGVPARDSEPFAPGYDLEAAGQWTWVPPPASRAAWQATLVDTAERGFRGLLVPADPRLIDLLRNPGDAGERLDLHLAQG